MKKMRLYVHQSCVDEALSVVQSLSSIEFIADHTDRTGSSYAATVTNLYTRIGQAVHFLEQYAVTPTLLESLLHGSYTSVGAKDIVYHQSNLPIVESVIRDVEALQVQEITEREEIKRLEGLAALLQTWKKLPFPLSDLSTKTTSTLLVEVPTLLLQKASVKDIRELLNRELAAYEALFHIELVSVNQAAVVTHGEQGVLEATLETTLKRFGGNIVSPPDGNDTPATEIRRVEKKLAEAKEVYATTQAQIGSFAKEHLGDLRVKHDILAWQVDRGVVADGASQTASTIVLNGWIKAPAIAKTEAALAAAGVPATLETFTAEPEEEPPVEIENSRLIRPFEFITRLYGLPSHRDLDPTVFLAGFFFLFFGLSLTDVGYGLFLMTAALLMLFVFKLSKVARQFGALLFVMGLGSTAVGLLFGGYFGIDPASLPVTLQAIQQFDPIANPLPVFYLALGLGVVQVMFGMSLKIVSDARNGQLLDGVLDQVPWLALFVFLLFYGAALFDIAFSEYIEQFLYLVYGALVAVVLTGARKGRTILQMVQYSFLSVYQSIGYFSDILSYSRLLALGLATTALAFAVNLIAEIVYEAVPYVGFIFALLVLAIGHAFTLAVNTLGAFIHSARLQFVEFFGKFITGSGRLFAPLARRETYVAVEDDTA